jgi:hypothetical protein
MFIVLLVMRVGMIMLHVHRSSSTIGARGRRGHALRLRSM